MHPAAIWLAKTTLLGMFLAQTLYGPSYLARCMLRHRHALQLHQIHMQAGIKKCAKVIGLCVHAHARTQMVPFTETILGYSH